MLLCPPPPTCCKFHSCSVDYQVKNLYDCTLAGILLHVLLLISSRLQPKIYISYFSRTKTKCGGAVTESPYPTLPEACVGGVGESWAKKVDCHTQKCFVSLLMFSHSVNGMCLSTQLADRYVYSPASLFPPICWATVEILLDIYPTA